MTNTYSFGSGKREGHDASNFYNRRMYEDIQYEVRIPYVPDPREWANKIICTNVPEYKGVPYESIALIFTSPPYNVGKDYDANMTYGEYAEFLNVFFEAFYAYLIPGGRFIINVANLGRKPYIPITKLVYMLTDNIGFLPRGEIIWVKAKGAGGNCAWGSWLSAKSPSLRDLHEYLLVFCKESFSRADKGTSTLEKDEFMRDTLSIWEIPPESAKRVGHPAPFPLELAERVINLFSYKGDVILDPFVGSGTTCVAAKKLGRYYIGVDNVPEYCTLSEERLTKMK